MGKEEKDSQRESATELAVGKRKEAEKGEEEEDEEEDDDKVKEQKETEEKEEGEEEKRCRWERRTKIVKE